MTNDTTGSIGINLQSLVDSHDRPFVVINDDYHILTSNTAFAHVFGVTAYEAIGNSCFSVMFGYDKPCNHMGESCPHADVFATGRKHACLHVSHDADNHIHPRRITAYPLRAANGQLYMGELIEQLPTPAEYGATQESMPGQSRPFPASLEQLNRAAGSESTALLQGETGTGTEKVTLPLENPTALQCVEASYIDELLQRKNGNRRKVAAALGISVRTLYRKLKRYGLR